MARVLTLAEFGATLDAAGDNLQKVLRDDLRELGKLFKQTARRNAQARFKRTDGTTGRATTFSVDKGRLTLSMGVDTSKAPGALIQDTGGTIRAKNGRWLYIPQPDGSLRIVESVTIRPTRWLTDAKRDTERAAPSLLFLGGALRDALERA